MSYSKVGISVLVTCCNLEKYLDECIQSIASQTKQPTEVIIVHDGCTNPRLYANTTSFCRTYNKGVAHTRSEAVSFSHYDNLLFLDADDCLSENFIQEMIENRLHYPDAILYPNVLLWSHWNDSQENNGWHEAIGTVDYDTLYNNNPCVVTSLIPRKIFTDLKGFDPVLPIFEDWDFFWQAYEKGTEFKKVPTTFLKYRQRTQSRNRMGGDIKSEVFQLIRDRYDYKKSNGETTYGEAKES